MMKTVLLLLSLLVSTQAWIDVKDRVKNRVIHIESLDERGRWLQQNDNGDSDGSRHLYINTLPERDLYYEPRYGFDVTLCDNGKYACLESISLRNYYLAAGYPPGQPWHVAKLVYSTYNEDNVALHWKLLCESESMEKCKIVPVRFEDEPYWLVRGGWDADLGWADEDENEMRFFFRIYAPNPSDGMREIYRNTNTGTHDHLVKYITMTGTSQTHETSESITSTTSVEIEGAFKAFSAGGSTSFSDSWTNTESSTYEESKTVEHDITIPGRFRISLYQLVGNYAGAFDVYTDMYCIEDESLDDEASRRFRLMKFDEKNRAVFLTKSVEDCGDL